jgi:hypothetical protein
MNGQCEGHTKAQMSYKNTKCCLHAPQPHNLVNSTCWRQAVHSTDSVLLIEHAPANGTDYRLLGSTNKQAGLLTITAGACVHNNMRITVVDRQQLCSFCPDAFTNGSYATCKVALLLISTDL